jgi:two-component system sensor histidine kinase BaeS
VLVAQDTATVRALTPSLLAKIVMALGLGLVAAVIAAALVSGSLARPLAGLAARARRLEAGERGVGAAASGVAELDDIEAALSSLDAALEHSEGRQREFLQSVSHEIRTPITTIRGYAEAMADGMTAHEETAEVGRILQAEVARLTAFTEDLLALSRLEADDFRLDLVDGVSLGALLAASAEAWRARAGAVGVTIDSGAAPGTPPLRTDPVRVRQVVDGLVDNALRVTPKGGAISLAAGPAVGGGVTVEVRDSGPGLTADDAALAFQRGALHARYRESRPVGSGLGLSIAARLVERLGGTIEAVPSGGGAIFRITLPPA